MWSRFHAVTSFPEAKAQELQAHIRHSTDLCLLFVEFQKQLFLNIGFDVAQGALSRFPAFAEYHHVIGIADEAMSSAFELVIKFVEHDVGEHWTHRTALRRPYFTQDDFVTFLYRGPQDLVDERDHSPVLDPVR